MAQDERPDLVIVARGGGSIEDLWAFNEEVVVRAIAESTIPVISAVGHETDTTLADFAADRRAPTPTAAAEMAVPVREELLAQLGELALRQRRSAARPLALGRERLAARAQRLPAPEALLSPYAQRLDDLGERLRRGLSERTHIARGQLQHSAGRLSVPLLRARLERGQERLSAQRLQPALLQRKFAAQDERLQVIWRMAEQLSPAAVLARGYAIVRDAGGRPIMSVSEAREKTSIELEFSDGRLLVGGSAVSAQPARSLRAPVARKPDGPEQGKLL